MEDTFLAGKIFGTAWKVGKIKVNYYLIFKWFYLTNVSIFKVTELSNSNSFIESFSSSKLKGNWYSRNCSRERWTGDIYFLWEWSKGLSVSRALWRWGGFLRRLQVSTVGLTECSKFLGLQAFGSLKALSEWDVYQNLAKFQIFLSRNCSNFSRFPVFFRQIHENLSPRNFSYSLLSPKKFTIFFPLKS